jgi:hypothetical protein
VALLEVAAVYAMSRSGQGNCRAEFGECERRMCEWSILHTTATAVACALIMLLICVECGRRCVCD